MGCAAQRTRFVRAPRAHWQLGCKWGTELVFISMLTAFGNCFQSGN